MAELSIARPANSDASARTATTISILTEADLVPDSRAHARTGTRRRRIKRAIRKTIHVRRSPRPRLSERVRYARGAF
jgi:hypothetical protein